MSRICKNITVALIIILAISDRVDFVDQKSEAFADGIPNSDGSLAAEEFRLGVEYVKRGDFEKAIANLQSAAAQFGAIGDYNRQIQALLYLGEAYQFIGNHKLTVQALDTALEIAVKFGDNIAVKHIKSSLGNAFLFTRDGVKAETYLDDALTLAANDGDKNLLAIILNNLGNLYATQGKYTEAAAAYSRSLVIAQQSDNHLLEAKILTNAASSKIRQGNQEGIEKQNDRALTAIHKLEDSHEKAYLFIILGNTYRDTGDIQPAAVNRLLNKSRAAYMKSIALAKNLGDKRAETYATGFLGQLYEQQHRYNEALTLTRKAAFIAQEILSDDALYRWAWQKGRLLNALGKREDAIKTYGQAIDILQSIRHDVAIGYGNINTRSSFRKAVGAVYFELADLLFQRADTESGPDKIQKTLIEARDTIELLKSAELDDYFQDDCVNLARSKIQSVDQIGGKTAVIYIIPLNDRIEFLLTLSSGLKRYNIDIGVEELTKSVKAFRHNLEIRIVHHYLPFAQQLYDWLIRPIEAEITSEQIDTLVFVPDGPLLTIPMAALHDGEQFLVSRFPIAVIPGLTLMDPHPITQRGPRMLKSGLSQAVQGFPQLTFVADELENLQAIYQEGETIQDLNFVTPMLNKAISNEDYSIVHIATHAQFHRDAKKTFLLTYDDKLTLNDLEDLIRPSEFRGKPVELLTLSACQTAAGDDRAALGLAGIAFKAGVRSVLATLWFVNDQASALLITEFYEQLRHNPSITKAKALQQSQLSLLNDPRFIHPGYWSPYLLIGNWL